MVQSIRCSVLFFLAAIMLITGCEKRGSAQITGDLKQWHKVTLTFEGPEQSEVGGENPFLDYRLQVTFINGNESFTVPGFFAADGNAAETSASAGEKWRVRFRPGKTGTWTYRVSFRRGENVAVNNDAFAGEAVPALDGESGEFVVDASDKGGRDFRGKGRLEYIGERYLQFAGSNDYFLKGGADSPENFLAYYQFDDTYRIGKGESRSGEARTTEELHRYTPHLDDWNSGDPVWQNEKGKEIIGALNYLAGKGVNSVYMLTMNIGGDGKDVWPYIAPDNFTRFDVSKLAQWEIVFDHMQSIGLMLHFVTQETENETLLDEGDTGLHRKLYYRELIARFGHHLAITWNMGEENGPVEWSPEGQTTRQQKNMTEYLSTQNPYNAFVVIHTHSNKKSRYEIFEPLLGYEHLDGPSMQIGNLRDAHSETKAWLQKSAEAGKQWVVCIDEIGPASRGVDPDRRKDNNQDAVRKYVLWANLMAGGGGAEWYFGYQNPHNDLNAEDLRSRDRMWDYTRYGIEFFQEYIPFWQMESQDDLTSLENDYVFAGQDNYVIYLPDGGTADLYIGETEKNLRIEWYNPREGGELQTGSIQNISGSGEQSIGDPPSDDNQDWVALVRPN